MHGLIARVVEFTLSIIWKSSWVHLFITFPSETAPSNTNPNRGGALSDQGGQGQEPQLPPGPSGAVSAHFGANSASELQAPAVGLRPRLWLLRKGGWDTVLFDWCAALTRLKICLKAHPVCMSSDILPILPPGDCRASLPSEVGHGAALIQPDLQMYSSNSVGHW